MGKTAIIGFGGAGYHAAKSLRENAPDEVIDVFTETPDAPYNPMLTTYYVAGKIERSTMMPYGNAADICNELKLNLFNIKVKKLHAGKRIIDLADGTSREYDDIVIATGSHPFVPPIKGLPEDKNGICVMRTVEDADRLLDLINKGLKSVVVIGASWVGIKVVEALYAHNVPTVLADMAPRIFPTATLPEVADIIHERLTNMGITLKFGSGIESIERKDDKMVCTFADGSQYESELVALCLGLRSTIDIIDRDEIEAGRSISVDLGMRTNVPHIYAVGDCCEAYEMITKSRMNVNLWANAFMQGEIAGKNIAGGHEEFQGNFIHNITHFLNMDFIGLGDNRTKGNLVVYQHPVEKWLFYAIVNENGIGCVNILDNHTVSGPAKAALIKRLSAPGEEIGPSARLALRMSGLPESIISQIGGM